MEGQALSLIAGLFQGFPATHFRLSGCLGPALTCGWHFIFFFFSNIHLKSSLFAVTIFFFPSNLCSFQTSKGEIVFQASSFQEQK